MSTEEFIALAARDLGIPAGTARHATREVLILLRLHIEPTDFDQLLASLPSARTLLETDAAQPIGTPHTGRHDKLAEALERAGLVANQLGPFLHAFFTFVKDSTDLPLTFRLIRDLPDAADLME